MSTVKWKPVIQLFTTPKELRGLADRMEKWTKEKKEKGYSGIDSVHLFGEDVILEVYADEEAMKEESEGLEHERKLIRLSEKIARCFHGCTLSRNDMAVIVDRAMKIRHP